MSPFGYIQTALAPELAAKPQHSDVCMCDECVSERQRQEAVDELLLAEIFRKEKQKA